MIASYRWIVGCTVLVGLLAGTLACAKSTKTPNSNPDSVTVLIISHHASGPTYLGKRKQGLEEFVTDHPGDNSLFDIFCSATDTELLRPDQNSPATAAPGSGSKPGRVPRHRYNLRPC
jgi:hypothetical protein